MADKKAARILLLGKTGAGKSSFINYFIGSDVAATGDGRPVTQDYCVEYEYNGGKYPVKIFDNKGFEAKTAAVQKTAIIESVKRHNNNIDVFNWFHTIFYCISAANSRFEPFEADFIRNLSSSISQNVHIIITQCDTADRKKLDEIKSTVKSMLGQSNIKIYEVVSIHKRKRNGDVVEPRGKEELTASVFRLLWEDIATRISYKYAEEMHYELVDTISDLFKYAKRELLQLISLKNFVEFAQDESSMDDKMEEITSNFENETSETMERINNKFTNILNPVAELYNSYTNTVAKHFPSLPKLDFDDWTNDMKCFDTFDDKMEKIFPCISNGGDDFWTIMGGIGEIITLKPRIKKLLDDVEKEAIDEIPSQETIQMETKNRLMEFLDEFCT